MSFEDVNKNDDNRIDNKDNDDDDVDDDNDDDDDDNDDDDNNDNNEFTDDYDNVVENIGDHVATIIRSFERIGCYRLVDRFELRLVAGAIAVADAGCTGYVLSFFIFTIVVI